MTQLFLRFLLAPDQDGNAAGNGNNANDLAVPKDGKTSDIIDDFVLPKSVGGGGQRGSKYVDDDIAAKVEKMQPKQGIVIPLMEGVTPKRHRYALKWRIDEWAKMQGVEEQRDGDKVIKAAIPAPKFSVAVLEKEGKAIGIGVRRDS